MARFRLTCVGTEPLLMHNSRLSNPLDDVSKLMKRITAKRKKTEEDYEELSRLEHGGALYFDEQLGPYLPGQNFEACLVASAKLSRLGETIKRGVFIESNVNPLAYDGPRSVEMLWKDENFRHMASAKVGKLRVMRTRPMFRQWSVYADGQYDPEAITFDELQGIAVTAGPLIGLGDWRPRFGRFTATLEKMPDA